MAAPADLDDVLKRILSLDGKRPHPAAPRRLDGLFRDLARFTPERPAYELQDLIWAVWTNHPDPAADAAMERAIRAIATKRHAEARQTLDALIADFPDWAEAWNKRATLAFILEDDAAAVADIARTLELEPRHFGAISGFAQICLRHGRETEALAAFEVALGVNPHLEGVKALVSRMHARTQRSLH